MERPKGCFTGLQIDGPALDGRDAGEALDEIQRLVPLNAAMIFHGDRMRRGPDHHGGTPFRHPVEGLDPDGRDLLDRLEKPAAARGVELILGVGEDRWGYYAPYHGYTTIAMVDCFGRTNRQSCVNHPVWRTFQLASLEDIVREHPYLSGIMFMHERVGPLSAVFFPGEWQGGRNPWCFCEHCRRKGRERGLDPEKARAGYQALLALFADGAERPVEGWFISFWRLLSRHPEILGWDQFQWDSLHDFRAAMAGAIRVANPKAHVGFHFQHATLTGQLFWRAGDDPARVIQYADWVKPSVYPGCSGTRYGDLLRRLHATLLADLPAAAAHAFLAGAFGRDPAIGAERLEVARDRHSAFPAEWVRDEVARLVKSCAPKPMYAGLGIGIPGGEEAETVEQVAAWTEACFDGGAHGILLSRHYSEMKPERLRAAGDVIRARGGF
jgi:hypothetical protein